MPTIQASEPASEPGTPPVSANVRAAFAVSVTGEASAIGCSQLGMLDTGTKTELAKTRGNSSTNPAVWAVSAPRTTRETNAKIQLSANPKAATRATHASAGRTPAWKLKPTG